jgi:hypothetical protein
MDDDFRELEPDISDHPFQPAPGQTPVAMSMSAAGPVATPGPSTPTSAERNQRPHKGSGRLTRVGQAAGPGIGWLE